MRRLGVALKIRDILGSFPTVNDWFSIATDRFNLYSGAANPTAAEVPTNQWIVYKNTTSGEVRIWVNDGGTLKKSVALT